MNTIGKYLALALISLYANIHAAKTSRGAQSRTDISPKPLSILISLRIFKTQY